MKTLYRLSVFDIFTRLGGGDEEDFYKRRRKRRLQTLVKLADINTLSTLSNPKVSKSGWEGTTHCKQMIYGVSLDHHKR